MDPGGGKTDEHIAGFRVPAGDQVLLIHDSYRESGQVIFVHRIESGHFGRLAADQGRSRLLTAFRHAADDGCDLLRFIFAAGDIIQEKQRLPARAGDIIHTHGYTVDTDGVMLVHQKRQF